MEPWDPRAGAVDLHIHTRCSDGTLTPADVVREARTRGLRAIAITDHDTIAGNGEALEAGRRLGVEVVPGVEISTQREGMTFHLLGYGMRGDAPGLKETFEFLVESRGRRNPKMAEKLRALGVDITMAEVQTEAGVPLVGRPHFARVLLRKGIVRSMQEAFDRYLGRGAPAYVDKERLSPGEACRMVVEAGGVPVLAHPGLVERDYPDRLGSLIEALLPLGLGGIEAYYSRHTPEQTLHFLRLAERLGLLATGGSDFHQPGADGPLLGTGFGHLWVPYSCFASLRKRLAAAEPHPQP